MADRPPAPGVVTFYGDDLAAIHEGGFSAFVRDSLPGLLDLLRSEGVAGGRVLELGCGGGHLLRALGEGGYEAVGIDVSAAMIAMSRERAPGAALIEGSFFDVEIPSCRAVLAVGECFNYVGNSGDPEESLSVLLRRVRDAIEPGGVLIFDMAVPGRITPEKRNAFFQGDGWAILTEAREREEPRVLEREITSFRRTKDGLYRRGFEKHTLRLHEVGEIEAMLASSGFAGVRLLKAYGERLFPAGLVGFVAQRG